MLICSRCRKPISNNAVSMCSSCGKAYCSECANRTLHQCGNCNGHMRGMH